MIPLAELKVFMGISSGDTTKDVLLQQYIDYVTEYLETYCNNIFKQRTITADPLDTYYRSGYDATDEIILKAFPVSALTLSYKGGALVSIQDYQSDLAGGTLYAASIPERSFVDYTVTYTAGYAANDMPKALKFVAAQMVKALYDANGASSTSGGGSSSGTVESKKIGDFSVTYGNNSNSTNNSGGKGSGLAKILSEVASYNELILNRYKRIGL